MKRHSLLFYWSRIGLILLLLVLVFCIFLIVIEASGAGVYSIFYLIYFLMIWLSLLVFILPLHFILKVNQKDLTWLQTLPIFIGLAYLAFTILNQAGFF